MFVFRFPFFALLFQVELYQFPFCVRCAATSLSANTTASTAATAAPASSREASERRSPTRAFVRFDYSLFLYNNSDKNKAYVTFAIIIFYCENF